MGMGESLIRAGAHSVLAPIWPVNNAEADKFLRFFYPLLKTLSRNAALRETQRHFSGMPLTWWAGWQLYGATGPLPPSLLVHVCRRRAMISRPGTIIFEVVLRSCSYGAVLTVLDKEFDLCLTFGSN